MEVFRQIPPDAPLIVVEAVWQYSHHVLQRSLHSSRPDPHGRELERRVAGPGRHAEPERIADQGRGRLRHAVERSISRMTSSCAACGSGSNGETRDARPQPREAARGRQAARQTPPPMGREVAAELRRDKAIMGIFDEGCMGMYNAIIPDEIAASDRRIQGAAEPVGAVRRDARGAGRRRRSQCGAGSTRRACGSSPGPIRRTT